MPRSSCVALLWMSVVTAAGQGADWPQWRGPNRDGVAPSSPPLVAQLPAEGLAPAWVSESLAGGFAGGWGSPIVADGRVYLFVHFKQQKTPGELPKRKFPYLADDKRGGMTPAEYEEYEKNRRAEELEFGKLFDFRERTFCLDAATGKTLWKQDKTSVYSRFVQSGTLTAAGGKLYILGAGRRARCLDAATGADVWDVALPGEFVDEFYMSSFAVVDGAAIVGAGGLFGLDAATGKLLWSGEGRKLSVSHTSPVAWTGGGASCVLVNVGGGETVCLDPRTGDERWRVKSEANQSTPVVVGNRLITYGSSRRSGLRCYDMTLDGAKEAWSYQRVADKGSSPVVVGGQVYVQGEKRMACVDLATGDEKWNATLDLASPQYTSLVAADGKVVYAYDGVICYAADPAEYRPLFDAKLNKAGLLAPESLHRRLLNLDEVEKRPTGLEGSVRIFKREVGDQGPLACTSPALVDGRLILRLRDRVACYDLRAERAAPSAGGGGR